jgi:hypothetical protein
LRETPSAKDAVIAIHTALTENDLRVLAQHPDPTVDLYLSKPITEEKLDALIAALQSPAKKRSRKSDNSQGTDQA